MDRVLELSCKLPWQSQRIAETDSVSDIFTTSPTLDQNWHHAQNVSTNSGTFREARYNKRSGIEDYPDDKLSSRLLTCFLAYTSARSRASCRMSIGQLTLRDRTLSFIHHEGRGCYAQAYRPHQNGSIFKVRRWDDAVGRTLVWNGERELGRDQSVTYHMKRLTSRLCYHPLRKRACQLSTSRLVAERLALPRKADFAERCLHCRPVLEPQALPVRYASGRPRIYEYASLRF